MSTQATLEWLSDAVGHATRSANFCTSGCLPVVDPKLKVQGLGPIKLPLKRAKVKALVELCQLAPYGKGTRTLVDQRVRKAFELSPQKFDLGDEWAAAIAGATQRVAEQLGLPDDGLEARLYKLLVYQPGGFFVSHRDSEKHDRMVASMIVALPNPFEGGELIVRHGPVEQRMRFQEAAAGIAPCYAAFYADCEHEVRRVSYGIRLALAYNLVLKPNRARRVAEKPVTNDDKLATSISTWVATRPRTPLVFALEHQYTERGLSLDLLKGSDRQLAAAVVSAAEKTDCLVHLAHVSRHLSQFADDGSFERGYWRRGGGRPRKLEIGETYEDDLHATQWTSLDGKKQPWAKMPLDVSAVVASTAIDDWQPTREEYEGYTGNAGNTLDRWYHRSAIVVWRREDHFEVIADCGAGESIPLFESMAAKLAKTPKKRLEAARLDCVRFARVIVSRWPLAGNYRPWENQKKPTEEKFFDRLLQLGDRETVAALLSMLAERDRTLPLKKFVIAACRQFGWTAFAEPLKQLITSRPSGSGGELLAVRDIEWLAAFCCDESADADKAALASELCGLAAERFCEPRDARPTRYYSSREDRQSSASESSLAYLLEALLAAGDDKDVTCVIQFVRRSPDEFRLEHCQVPTLKTLVAWSQKRAGSLHPQIAAWLADVRRQLELATANAPTPPADWSRPAEVDCKCRFCAQLSTFLADPASEVTRIAAPETMRGHLIDKIDRHQCDVKHALERKGSPYSLVLTKTTGSFQRAVKEFATNRRLLSALPAAE
jgi:hypothetical protein